jgi:Protein of unknown function (DUF2914)
MQFIARMIFRHFLILVALFAVPFTVSSQEAPSTAEGPTLVKAVMSESIEKFVPVNPSIVFSIELGRIACFTEFDPVPEKSVIHHKWYRKDSLISVKKLTVTPPRWSSFSSMQLRDADKGPWRVEVTDEHDKLIRSLRFSITD